MYKININSSFEIREGGGKMHFSRRFLLLLGGEDRYV